MQIIYIVIWPQFSFNLCKVTKNRQNTSILENCKLIFICWTLIFITFHKSAKLGIRTSLNITIFGVVNTNLLHYSEALKTISLHPSSLK